MWKDPIVTETRALRDEYARQFSYNADAMFEDLMAKQAAHLERVVSLPPRKASSVNYPRLKAGACESKLG